MKKNINRYLTIVISFIALDLVSSFTYAEERNFDDVNVKTTKITEGIYMLEGAGGNIGVSSGVDGLFLIDDQFSAMTDKVLAALTNISDKPVKFLINTHIHPDHTGGNENLGKQGVVIVAHDNVYQRMTTEQFIKPFNDTIPKAAKEAMPVMSFNDQMTFHLNGSTIKATHHPHAHTDGDTTIHFIEDNVFFMGDLFYNNFYPFVDLDTGGSIYGIINATQAVINQADENSIIVPGHGKPSTKKELIEFHNMLLNVINTLEPLVEEGMALDEIRSSNPIKPVTDKWGTGYLKPAVFIEIIYNDILQNKAK